MTFCEAFGETAPVALIALRRFEAGPLDPQASERGQSCRGANDQRTIRNDLAFGISAWARSGSARDDSVVENDGAHADQCFVADPAAVQDGAVADRAGEPMSTAHPCRYAHAQILDIGALPNIDQLIVAAQHGTKPDAAPCASRTLPMTSAVGATQLSGQCRENTVQCIKRHG